MVRTHVNCLAGLTALGLVAAVTVGSAAQQVDVGFRVLGQGPCETAPANLADVLTYHAETVRVCWRFCFVEGFPCAAVDYDAQALRCVVHFGPVTVAETGVQARARTCYVKTYADTFTEGDGLTEGSE